MNYDERIVEYLMRTCGVSRGLAVVALQYNRGSTAYAQADLYDETRRERFRREAREYGLE